MPLRLLLTIYLAILLTPLALAIRAGYPPRSFLDEIASGAAMLAFAIILVEFTLSGRYRAVSRRAGMDVTMRIHQLIARTALAAALIHPFLYQAEWNAPYPWDTSRSLTVTSEPTALATGIAAWLLLPALVLMALPRGAPNYRYSVWRWAHGLGALLIAGLILHHTLTAGRYAADPVLAGYWWLLSGVALATCLWTYVVVPIRQSGRPWRVVAVEPAAERVWRVEIAPDGHPGLDYDAGQFAWLTLGRSPFLRAENPFSIASAPGSGPNLAFLIKELGDFTRHVGQVPAGARAYVDGPHGALTLTGRPADGIGLIAGGIGIAPLIAILRQLSIEDDPRPRKLIYADRDTGQMAHLDELDALARAPETDVDLVLARPEPGWTGETGFIDRALLARHFPEDAIRTWVFVLCGPPPMLDAVEAALIDLGVSPERVLSERFDYD